MNKMLTTTLLVALFLCLASISFGDQPKPNGSAGKVGYEKEMEEFKKENPEEYKEAETMFVLITQMFLARLGHFCGPFDGILDEKTKSALLAYENRRGIPETGNPLSFETSQKLQEDIESLDYQPVMLPSLLVFTDYWDRGYVIATGTWVMVGDKSAFPEQTCRISCDKASGTCTQAIATVKRIGGGEGILSVEVEEYEIERWDEHEIVTKPRESDLRCVRYIIRINKLQKSVTSIRSTISNEDLCEGLDASEIYMELTDGFDVYWELVEERNKKLQQLHDASPSLLERLKAREGKLPAQKPESSTVQ